MRRLPFCLLACCLLGAPAASAHQGQSATSTAFLDFGASSATLVHDSPDEDLQRAMHVTLFEVGTARGIVAKNLAALLQYARQHVRLYAARSGTEWTIDDVSVEGADSPYGPRARFVFRLIPPKGDGAASVRLEDDIIVHEVTHHDTLVYVRHDWPAGVTSDQPRLVGTLKTAQRSVVVQRDGSLLRGLGAVARMGMSHIASGADHVLFLFMLLLPAPLIVIGRRYGEPRGTRSTLSHLAATVTAFTVGHSVTLAAQTLGAVDVHASIVEPAIALSIAVTAAHALRPVAAGAEVFFAGGFGLLHGLGFAAALTSWHLGGSDGALTLLGFNLGIEAAQLLILAAVVPWVLLLARTRWYMAFRVTGGLAGMILALGWGFERLTGHGNPLAPLVDVLQRHPGILLASLAAFSLLAYLSPAFRSAESANGRR